MTKLRFAGRKKELREFLDFLRLVWGNDREVRSLPDVVCGGDGQSTQSCGGTLPQLEQATETSVV
jgi:hypothetical protein